MWVCMRVGGRVGGRYVHELEGCMCGWKGVCVGGRVYVWVEGCMCGWKGVCVGGRVRGRCGVEETSVWLTHFALQRSG